MASLSLSLLGRFEARLGDEALGRFRSNKAQALLIYLATERGGAHRRDSLMALLWPGLPQRSAGANLRQTLYLLRQMLPEVGSVDGAEDAPLLLSDRQTVSLNPEAAVELDVARFEELLSGSPSVGAMAEAAALYRGDFCSDFYLPDSEEFEDWVAGRRAAYRTQATETLRALIDHHINAGEYPQAIAYARRAIEIDSLDGGAHRGLMEALALDGQGAAALRHYGTLEELLEKELGVTPSAETMALAERIRAGEIAQPEEPEPIEPRLVTEGPEIVVPAFLWEEAVLRAREPPVFVAREKELAWLTGYLDRALSGQGQVVFVTGGPGRGKTALMTEFARRAMESHPDLLAASGSCNAFAGVGDPYLPFRDVMAMLTGDVESRWAAGAITRDHALRLWAAIPLTAQALMSHGPHLVDIVFSGEALLSRATAAAQDSAPWLPRLREHVSRQPTRPRAVEQSHLFQQFVDVLRTVSREQPLLLILDDLQWADTASIGLLFHLGRRLADADSRILIACAYRPEDVALDRAGERHSLAMVLSEFKRIYGDVWVDLSQADRTEGRSFVDALLDAGPNRLAEAFRATLFHRTEAHPLFTIELLRAMQERGNLAKDEDGFWIEGPALDWEALPARVEAVIAERVDRLDPDLQEILTVASVEGEVFTAQVIAQVQEMAERPLLHRLSQDLERRHRLVREQEEVHAGRRRVSRYRFRHVLFQNYVYNRLSLGERRLLHGAVAAALESLYDRQLDEMAVQLAHHYQKAEDYDHTLRYLTRAAERAFRLYANDEAITHYTRAIEVAERVSPDVVSLTRLHRGRGLACERLGDFHRARADHDTILRIARASGERQVEEVEWRALLDLGKLWSSRDYNQTRDCFESALELARRMDHPALLAESLNWMGNWYTNSESPLKAVEYHQEALRISEELGEARDLANTLDLLGIAHVLAADLSASVKYYDRAIALFRELDDRSSLASSLMGRATVVSQLVQLASVPAVPPPESARDCEEALLIAQEIESAPDEAWALWVLGLLYTVQGQFGRALDCTRNGLGIALRIGHREWEVGNRSALGVLCYELFAPEQARRELERALTLAGELQSQYWIHQVSGALAGVYLTLNEPKLAQASLEKVISPQTRMDTMGKRYCWARWAQLALAQGDPAPALDITDRLIASAPGLAPGRVITFLWKLKGEVLMAIGHTDEAESLLRRAVENARATGERFLLWRVHASIGQLYCTTGRQEAAEKEFSTARGMVKELAATIPDEALKTDFLQGAYNMLDLD